MKSEKFFICLLFLALLNFPLNASSLNFTFSFERPGIMEKPNGVCFIYQNCINMGIPTTPYLPYYGVNVLLPQGQEIDYIRVIDYEYHEILRNITVMASPYPSHSNNFINDYSISSPTKTTAAYAEDNTTNKIISLHMTDFLSGHSIGSFCICPVIYDSRVKTVVLISSIEIEVVTKPSERAGLSQKYLRETPEIIDRITNLVINPELISEYLVRVREINHPVDLLILTNEELSGTLSQFVDYKNQTGYYTEIYIIPENWDPYDIRYVIETYYEENGLTSVLLVGDADGGGNGNEIIPAFGYTGIVQTDLGPEIDENIPGDFFYSEFEDGYLSEIFIGRWAVDNAGELENIINKTILYENQPIITNIKRALLIGSFLGGTPNQTQGWDHKNEIIDSCPTNGYTTTGIPLEWGVDEIPFGVTKLYGNPSPQTIYNEINGENWFGLNLINVAAHGNNFLDLSTIEIENVNAINFTNNGIDVGFPICYSWACYSGAFDNRNKDEVYFATDCISEEFISLETGMVGYIANSRYGWYFIGNTDGASQHFDREFFDAIFGEIKMLIGIAFVDQKDDVIPYITIGEGSLDWCFHEINMFCDPTLDIWTDIPTTIIADYKHLIRANELYVDFQISNPTNERIALLQNDELIGRESVDENGFARVSFDKPLDCFCPIEVSIIGHNKIKHEGIIEVEPLKISGTTYREGQGPIGNVYVYLYKIGSDEFVITPSYGDNIGQYEFNLCNGWSGKIIPLSVEFPNWLFMPNERSYVNISEDFLEQDYTQYYIPEKKDFDNEFELNNIDNTKSSTNAEQITISNIYPNPLNNELNIHYTLQEIKVDNFLIIKNIVGKIQVSIKLPPESNSIKVSLNELNLGVYLIYIQSHLSCSEIKKIVKM